MSSLEEKIEKKLSDTKLFIDGVDPEKIEASKTSITIAQETFSGEKTSKIDSYLKISFWWSCRIPIVIYVYHYLRKHDYAKCH